MSVTTSSPSALKAPSRQRLRLGLLALFVTAAIAFWFRQASAEQAVLTRALVTAVQNGDSEEVERLLRAGADPNAFVGSDLHSSFSDRIALWLRLRSSASAGDPLIVEAVYRANPAVVRALLEHGADPNRKDTSGISPLRRARSQNAGETIQLLIAHGARD